jgi:AGZA family xanthine/uracil permease-like MFS transporter
MEINWYYIGDAVPAFLTILIIPLTYKLVVLFVYWFKHWFSVDSIAYGVIAGILSYILLNGLPLLLKTASGGRIVPVDYEAAEEWVIPPGGMIPPWM